MVIQGRKFMKEFFSLLKMFISRFQRFQFLWLLYLHAAMIDQVSRPGFARCNHEEAIRRIRRQRYTNDRLKASRENLIYLNQPETLNNMLEGYPSNDEVNKFLFDWCHFSDTAILDVLYHIIENPQWAAIDKW